MSRYPINFWVFMSVCFVNSMAQMVTVFISLFLHKHNITITNIGVLISIFGIGGVIGGFLGGFLSDYLSPMRIARISSLANAMLIFLFIFCHNLWFIGLDLFFMGLFNSLFRPASLLLILTFDTIGKPSIIMSYRRVFVNLGVSVGVMFSGVLFNYNELFVFIFSACFVFISFISLLFLSIDFKSNHSKSKEHKPDITNKVNYKLYCAMLFLTFGLLAYNQQQTIYGIYLNDYLHVNTTKLSFLFAINGILVVLCQIPLTYSVRNISPFILSSIGGLLIGCGFGLIIFEYGYLIALLSVLLWSIGELLLFPSAFDIMLKLGGNKPGKNMGLYQTTFSISSLIGPSLGAFMYGINIRITWWACIMLGVFSFIGFLSLRSEHS